MPGRMYVAGSSTARAEARQTTTKCTASNCSRCLTKDGKRKATAPPPKRKATAPPEGAGAGKSKTTNTKKFFTNDEKLEVLKTLDRHVSQTSVADKFGCSVRKVCNIIKKRAEVEEKAATAGLGGKKTSRQGDFPEVDRMALDLFAKAREARIAVTRDVIRSFGRSAKATLLATATTSAALRNKLEDFQAGEKWAKNLVRRNGLHSQRLHTFTLMRMKRGKTRRMMTMRARSPWRAPHPPMPNCRLTSASWRQLRRSVGTETLLFICRKPGYR